MQHPVSEDGTPQVGQIPTAFARQGGLHAAPGLAPHLLQLADGGSRPLREYAARVLLTRLGDRAPAMLAKSFGTQPKCWGVAAWTMYVEDAVQHLLAVASTGRAPFRGRTEQQAFVWCERVLRNFVLTELRRRDGGKSRTLNRLETDALVSPGCFRALRGQQQPLWNWSEPEPVDVAAIIRELCSLVGAEIHASRRSNDARTLCASIHLWLDDTVGCIAFCAERVCSGKVAHRAESGSVRDSCRQRRHRGRAAAVAALEHLRSQGTLPPTVAHAARRLGVLQG